MKALENSNRTTLQAQVLVFGFRNLSTITPDGHSIALTSILTLAGIIGPNARAKQHDGQIINHTSTCVTQTRRTSDPLDTTRAPTS